MEQIGQFIINHWQLWLALIIILLLIFINEAREQKKKAKSVSPQAAVDLINHEDAVVIDLRDKDLYKQGHIIDAVRMNADDLDSKRLNKYKDRPIILVCARGLQSPNIAAKLQTEGFTQVMTLNGGMASWQAAQLPVVKSKG